MEEDGGLPGSGRGPGLGRLHAQADAHLSQDVCALLRVNCWIFYLYKICWKGKEIKHGISVLSQRRYALHYAEITIR